MNILVKVAHSGKQNCEKVSLPRSLAPCSWLCFVIVFHFQRLDADQSDMITDQGYLTGQQTITDATTGNACPFVSSDTRCPPQAYTGRESRHRRQRQIQVSWRLSVVGKRPEKEERKFAERTLTFGALERRKNKFAAPF